MTYNLEKFSFANNTWEVHLRIAPFKFRILYFPNTEKKAIPPNYKVVTLKHQIDEAGNLFACSAWNIRQQASPNQINGTPLAGVRYATQFDFDKFCFENPDEKNPDDWNTKVYKAFISTTTQVTYSLAPAFDDDSEDEEYEYF